MKKKSENMKACEQVTVSYEKAQLCVLMSQRERERERERVTHFLSQLIYWGLLVKLFIGEGNE